MFVIDPEFRSDRGARSAPDGHSGGGDRGHELRSDLVNWMIPGNDDALRAIRLFTSKISDAVVVGRQSFEQSQIADQKAARERPAKRPRIMSTPAPTKCTRSRKATSWKASRRTSSPEEAPVGTER